MSRYVFIADLIDRIGQEVAIKGWVRYLRTTKTTTFIVLQDASGTVQAVGPSPCRST